MAQPLRLSAAGECQPDDWFREAKKTSKNPSRETHSTHSSVPDVAHTCVDIAQRCAATSMAVGALRPRLVVAFGVVRVW